MEMHSEGIRELIPSGYVGFDSLPWQMVERCLKDDFIFNILCVGETGIGKSTLISSLFNLEINQRRSKQHTYSPVGLKTRKYYLEEKEVHLKLSVTETVGYGDQINKKGDFEVIVKYIDSQFEKYLQEELKFKRNLAAYLDTRIHVCLYFICPTGHTLKATDLLALKQLSSRANLIPLIAKADTLTREELQDFKSNIRKELLRERIEIYQFQSENEALNEFKVVDDVPFAVIGSTDVINDGEFKSNRARNYPWGIVFIENEVHSDFVKLRQLLVETHMEDSTSSTHTRHYQNYREKRLRQCGFEDFQHGDGQSMMNLMEMLEAKTREMRRQFQAGEEEMIQSFKEKVIIEEQKLAGEEQRIKLKYKALQDQHEEEQRILDEEKKLLERDIDLFRKEKREFQRKNRK